MVQQTKTIAWIEDDIDIIFPVVQPLKDAGFDIQEYRTYADVIDNLDEVCHCDFVLLDLILPPGRREIEDSEMLGLKLLDVFRQRELKTPILILSVIARTPEVSKKLDMYSSLNLRVQPKGVRPSRLRTLIEEMLNIED